MDACPEFKPRCQIYVVIYQFVRSQYSLIKVLGTNYNIDFLRFQRELPDWACKFFELVLIVTADHGPAVSGAHNTMVTARAGKDLISSVVSGLLTIVSSTFLVAERGFK